MSKWKMNRAGLLNFWYYDEEVFTFADGKLLLRGSNGSGKSVTMQSFLPVLLDGKKSPDRLDPFGSKARRMEDYLLGEKEIVNRDERTGYLFLEFKREGTDQYTTIGIGLQAKRYKQMKFWGFVITDNRRIGYDFDLYKIEQHAGEKQKIPRSRIELENVIGEGGHVVQTQSEYMKLVNKYLFGFESIEAYEDLIKLLIQLRSPKLSKDFKPTVIYEILEAALPPLSDEDLRHLSDTIEQMDQTKQQIEQLEREVDAITSLNRVYTTYNQRILADHAYEFINTAKRLTKEENTQRELEEKKGRLDEEIQSLNQGIQKLSQQQDTYQKQKDRLQSHKVWNLEKELRQEKDNLYHQNKEIERKEDQLSVRRNKERQVVEEQDRLEEVILERKQTMDDQLVDMSNDAEESSFDQHEQNQQDFARHQHESFDFSVWLKEVGNHLKNLEQTEKDFRIFEQLKSKYQDKDNELANENKQLDDATYQKQEWVRLFNEDKEKKLHDIYTWVESAEWLKTDESVLQEAARAIHSLYEPITYETVRALFRDLSFNYEQEQRKKLSKLKFNQEQLEGHIEQKEYELQEWKDKKDPEPAIHPVTREARQKLNAAGISYVPFYAAVEFQDHVDTDVRKRIEAAIFDSGMLDALIASEDIMIEHDRVLTPEPNMMVHTLADYLKPDIDAESSVSASRIDDVLRSILIADDESSVFSISEEGHYQIGLLKGHAVPIENVRYIGRTARKRFREEQIQIIKAELDALDKERRSVLQAIQSVEESISKAKVKLNQFPNDEDLQESFRQIEKSTIQIEQHKERMKRLSNELKEIHIEYSKVKRTIDEQTRILNLEASLSAYQEAIIVAKRYEKDLFAIENEHIKYVNDVKRQEDLASRLAELVDGIDELKGELNVVRDLAERTKQNMNLIEIQLEQQGMTDIRKQIAEVQHALQEIGVNLKEKEITLPRKESDKNHLKNDLEVKRNQVDFWANMKEAWEGSFAHELSRGFVHTNSEEKELLTFARDVLKKHGILLKEKDSSKLAGQLTQEFYKQQSNLMEYRMNSFDGLIKVPDWMRAITDEEKLPHIEQWKQKVTRRVIELEYQGKQVSPYTVQKQLEQEQERQETMLDEQDQALYEEILFKSVGNKLRARIRRAEQWAQKMNALMESRDTSSGLSFSIKWKPRTADSETEMDTVDLVHLLKQDAKLLKEEDLDKITVHFRSKIAKAKEMMDDSSEIQTLLQVLKEVLDYRKWFSFVLSFRREGEPKRELTNNQFYKFSGGEKAMAMYIPLFTACYSRYQEADSAAPYIVSLDEAFAGVDENNIREMFEILEHLGFDYIMNSQVLWGDYDTISQLSICELVRPKNADFVSVIRYHWDGNQLEFEVPEETEDQTFV